MERTDGAISPLLPLLFRLNSFPAIPYHIILCICTYIRTSHMYIPIILLPALPRRLEATRWSRSSSESSSGKELSKLHIYNHDVISCHGMSCCVTEDHSMNDTLSASKVKCIFSDRSMLSIYTLCQALPGVHVAAAPPLGLYFSLPRHRGCRGGGLIQI